MTQPETEIRTAWRRIAGPTHDGYVDALLIRYAEPHRSYHTATHIMFVLRHLHDLARAQSAATLPSPEVVAAGLYHDAIYDPKVDTNEALSAALAARDLADIGWSTQRCDSVAAMIIATAGHLADIDDGQWRTGRSMVLQHFLDRPRLFVTDYMYAAAEHRARANIESELAALSHHPSRND
jgi:predicted metal-dependent HD superfamily phosphohydrolase